MNKNVRRITDGAMMTAIVAVFLLIDRWLGGVLSSSLMFVLPLPMVFYSCKYGLKQSWTVFIAMVLISLIVSTPSSIFYVASESFIGMLYGDGVRRNADSARLVLLIMVVGAVVNVLDTVLISALLGYPMSTQISEFNQVWNETISKSGGSADMQTMMKNMLTPQLISVIFIVSSILLGVLQGFITHVLSRFMLKKLRFHVAMPRPVSEYFPPKWTGYVAIGLLVVFFYAYRSPLSNEIAQDCVLALGMCGLLYLLIFGFISFIVYVEIRNRKMRGLAVLLGLMMMFTGFSMILVILGFLYITTNMHARLLEVAGNAEKNQ